MGEETSRWERFRRKVERLNDRAERWLRKHARRGPGYRIGQVITWTLIALIVILVGLMIIVAYVEAKVSLEPNTILSIIVADIPVSLVFWFAFQRRESKRRKLLDASQIVQEPKLYTHLAIHYCDDYTDGIPPDVRYYIVNTKSKVAYFVDKEIQDLVEARFIRKFPRHRDPDELNRYFNVNGIIHASGYPQGDDLFRDAPFPTGETEAEEEEV
jgi:hypothetical protein